jgi:hypothetical protein
MSIRSTNNQDLCSLGIDVSDGRTAFLRCEISLSEYPKFKILPENCALWIWGTISSIDYPSIYLTNVDIEIAD